MARSFSIFVPLRVTFAGAATLLCLLGGGLGSSTHAEHGSPLWVSWKLPAADGRFEIDVRDDLETTRRIGVEFVLPPPTIAASESAVSRSGDDRKQPVVVLLHGVEGASAGRVLHLLQARRLAAAGYQVFLVHYFEGLSYRDLLLYRDEKQLDVEAIRDVAMRDHQRWTRAVAQSLTTIAERPGVDRERMALLGYSLGSFVGLAATAEADAQPEIPDVSALVCNWGAKFETTQFTKTFPPTLLLHGELDEVVPVSEARKTAAALIAAGVSDVRFKTYAREPHTILTGSAADDAQQATLAFLRLHLDQD